MEVWEERKGPAGTREAFFWDGKEAGKSQIHGVDEKQNSMQRIR